MSTLLAFLLAALPATGAISFSAIQTEFARSGANPIGLSEYKRGGSYVFTTDTGVSGIPTTNSNISVNAFHGAARATTGPVSPLTGMNITATYGGAATMTDGVSIVTNGTIAGSGSLNYAGPANWYSPTTTGIGSSYWVKFTLNSGSAWAAGLVNNTIYALTASRTIQWSTTIGTTKTASVTVSIYSDSGGTTLVSSGTMAVSLDNT
jgi:hypothetical protein